MVRKNNQGPKDIIRSSAAEYLTFIAASGEGGKESFELRYEDENIWLSQKMMAELYGVSVAAINQHIKKILSDKELTRDQTIKKYLIVQDEGGTLVKRNVVHYNLQMIIAVGFKVYYKRAVAFRKWANTIVKEFTIKGWVMDDERLKNGGSVLTRKYFEEQLQRIRDIRASERMFYQKITDIYTTAVDYDKSSKTTQMFFKTVQNKLHYATHRHTAPELIMERANAKKPHMGLTSWRDAPDGKILKTDVEVAKNYLNEKEMDYLSRIVTMYLDYAELQASRNIPMTMEDWAERLDGFLEFNGSEILMDAGKISAEEAKLYAESQFEKYRIIQDRLYESDFDRFLAREGEERIEELKKQSGSYD